MNKGKPKVCGLGASAGVITGRARVVFSVEDADATLKAGEVLVTIATDPSFTAVMQRAAAIVTDIGGVLSHAAIVARELGIPCVVGCGDATTVVTDGEEITVDGLSGFVWGVDQ